MIEIIHKPRSWHDATTSKDIEMRIIPTRHGRPHYESLYPNSSSWTQSSQERQSQHQTYNKRGLLLSEAILIKCFVPEMPPKHLAHKRIKEKDLLREPRGLFSESRHNSLWLSSKVVNFSQLRGDELTKRQNKALHWYRTASIFNLSSSDEHQKDTDVLLAYQTLFDDLFFFGSLFRRCTSLLSDPMSAKDGERDGVFIKGQTIRDTGYKLRWFERILNTKKPLEVEITIFRDRESDRRKKLKGYLATLLHEMCHAFLDLWGCRFEGCYDVWEMQGKGHGVAWQDMALAVEVAVGDKSLLGLDLDLGRKNSLAVELVHDRKRALSDTKLAKWGIEQDELDEIKEKVMDQHLVTKMWGKR